MESKCFTFTQSIFAFIIVVIIFLIVAYFDKPY